MNKVLLIIKREFSTRVKKKSFLVLTLLGPLLFGALIIAPSILMNMQFENRVVMVLDKPGVLQFDPGKDEIQFKYINPDKYDLEEAKKLFLEKEDYALLYIPSGESWDPDFIASGINMYGKGDVSIKVQNYIEDKIATKLRAEKLKLMGVEPEVIGQSKVNVRIRTFNIDKSADKEEQSAVELKMAVGFICAILIYVFIFMYGNMVMKGVIEEKTNRVVEVIISSVKPFQLMLGKIAGIALVGLLQFVIWIVLTMGIYTLASTVIFKEKFDAAKMLAQQQEQAKMLGGEMPIDIDASIEMLSLISNINFPLILSVFLFFFLFGYLLYGSLFAAIGAAVDNETDAQQLTLPVTIPMILAFISVYGIIDNPESNIATIFSLIPLTSPIIMMMRVPFGVGVGELILSMVLLVLFFLFMVWVSARIYRVGILMYGKKPTFKELFKWISYKE